MNPKKLLSVTIVALSLAGLPPAYAQQRVATPEGLQVEGPSRLRSLVPAEQLETMSAEQYAEMMAQAKQKGLLAPPSAPMLQKLRSLAEDLIPYTDRWNERASEWNWEVNLIRDESINAFCMPGGKIAFFSGIIEKLNLTDDEIAVVMGHEMAHALREHARERVAKSGLASAGAQIAGFGLSAVFGIDPNLTSAATGGIANLAMLRFSRGDEIDADLIALDLVARAGYDPRAGIAVWKKMQMINKNSPPQWLSTHPAGGTRIKQMNKHMDSVLPLYAKTKGTTVERLPPYPGA
jgi:predicted Zn-dependent protease